MATFTNIGNAGHGVYRHPQTNIVLHEVSSIAELRDFNGALAHDQSDDSWHWVAGDDLIYEISRGGNSLSALAQRLLTKKFVFAERAMSVVDHSNSGVTNFAVHTESSIPACWQEQKIAGTSSDRRLFGILTNATAGRGCSQSLMQTQVNFDSSRIVSGYIDGDLGTIASVTNKDTWTLSGTGGGAIFHNQHTSVVGRAIIPIPLKSWSEFLAQWAASVDNNDKSEVQAVIQTATQKFVTLFQDKLFSVPVIRVPVVLLNTGKAYIDLNETTSVAKTVTSAPHQGVAGDYTLFKTVCSALMPSICNFDTGIWITNPMAFAPGVAGQAFTGSVSGLGGDALNVLFEVANTAALNVGVAYTCPYTEVKSIDGVDLCRLLGGLFAYTTPATGTAFTSQALVQRGFRRSMTNEELPAMGTQTDAQYELTVQNKLDENDVVAGSRYNWGHWVWAGQNPIVATVLLDLAVVDKQAGGSLTFSSFSGVHCKLMRPAVLANQSINWRSLLLPTDLMSDPARYFGSAY